jgi:plasmid stabilization system protein ParE
MNLIYSPRAVQDLENIAAYYRSAAGPKIAGAIAQRIERVIERIARQPHTAPKVAGRSNVRVVLVFRYPYKIFYRTQENMVEILHIRHTARQPWFPQDQ